MFNLKFTQQDALDAFRAWGFNCGPAALCAATGRTPAEIRPVFEAIGFKEKRYTNPTMMMAALANLKVPVMRWEIASTAVMFQLLPSLVRIQWGGPWTEVGLNPKWAYRQTHWIASWLQVDDCKGCKGSRFMEATCGACGGNGVVQSKMIFDCDGGIRSFESWKTEIVPALTLEIPRANGSWFPTHVWRIDQ